jgi:hypothetical protein
MPTPLSVRSESHICDKLKGAANLLPPIGVLNIASLSKPSVGLRLPTMRHMWRVSAYAATRKTIKAIREAHPMSSSRVAPSSQNFYYRKTSSPLTMPLPPIVVILPTTHTELGH